MPFVKLDCGILDSSLWVEDPATRIVFITILAMSDLEGLCRATAPGISRRANLGIGATRKALLALESPDPDDRSGKADGRRIERVEGGYQVLNYAEYRDRDYSAAERMRRLRQRRKADNEPVRRNDRNVRNVPPNVTDYTRHILDTDNTNEQDAAAIASADWEVARHDLADTWLEKWPGSTPPPQLFKALKPLVKKHGWLEVKPRFREFLRKQEAQWVNPYRFAATWTDWQRSIPL